MIYLWLSWSNNTASSSSCVLPSPNTHSEQQVIFSRVNFTLPSQKILSKKYSRLYYCNCHITIQPECASLCVYEHVRVVHYFVSWQVDLRHYLLGRGQMSQEVQFKQDFASSAKKASSFGYTVYIYI